MITTDKRNLARCQQERNDLANKKKVFQLYLHSKVRRGSQLDESLGFQEIVGIVESKLVQTLARRVFRCTKGNFIMVSQEIREQNETP